jgi:hypothetical protein
MKHLFMYHLTMVRVLVTNRDFVNRSQVLDLMTELLGEWANSVSDILQLLRFDLLN